jgi:signal transduction histidine kinase
MPADDAVDPGGRADEQGGPRWAVGLAWASFGLIVAGFVAGVWLSVLNGGVHSDLEAGGFESAIYLTFPIAGVALATKRPRNPLGWLMLAIGACFLSPLASYARYVSITSDGALPGAGLALAIHYPSWVVFIGLSGFLLMLFPDGHLPSPRWRWFAWTCGIGLVLLGVQELLLPEVGTQYDLPDLENPIAVEAIGGGGDLSFLQALVVFAPLTVVGGAVAMIGRLRRAEDPVQREQLRWLAWAAGVMASLYVVAIVVNPIGASESWQDWAGIVASSSFALIPVTIGIAVLRYRLFDIDFVIRKTVVLAVMVSVIVLVYLALVVGVGALVGSGSSPTLSALAAAVVALVFQPARIRARRFADRIVFGERATPYEVMAAFGDQLSGAYAAEDVLPRMARVLGEGVGAERAEVRLVAGDEMRTVAVWPVAAPGARDRTDDVVAEVRHQGELLGALAVTMPANDPIDPPRRQLVQDLAAGAGLVLRNERLAEQLRARLADLQAAQKRLVATQDDERRKLERNIHDGAQQQLVALQVRQRLAEQLVDRQPEKAKELVGQLQADTTTALADLRDLARGIYPPLLADEGLVAALEAQARRVPVPVRVEAAGVGRYPQEIEAAVYFSTLEALQNTAKYADAGSATVALAEVDGSLTFSITDDGAGFDPDVVGRGTGLQGIEDRLGALDGLVTVTSSPGEGTVVAGSVELDRALVGGRNPA